VLVIGNGNAAAAAARTAAALGARVIVLTRTAASRAAYARAAPDGVRVLVNEPATLQACLAEADLVIGAIRDSTFGTPAMICERDLALMRPGAVIVDVTCGYGPGYLPTSGPVQQFGEPPRLVRGVLQVKLNALPSLVPVTAVEAYTRTAAPYLLRLARVALLGAHDVAIDSALIASDGALVHPVVVEHAAHYGLPS
jgi:alanine dehydrogenase